MRYAYTSLVLDMVVNAKLSRKDAACDRGDPFIKPEPANNRLSLALYGVIGT